PGMSDLTAFAELGNTYGGLHNSPNGHIWTDGVFTRGKGLTPTAIYSAGVRQSFLDAGFIGVWQADAWPNAGPTIARNIRWVFLPPSSWAYIHDAATSGYYRYDIVTCAINEAAGVLTTRPFQDADTGAQTATSINKQM